MYVAIIIIINGYIFNGARGLQDLTALKKVQRCAARFVKWHL